MKIEKILTGENSKVFIYNSRSYAIRIFALLSYELDKNVRLNLRSFSSHSFENVLKAHDIRMDVRV